MRLADVTLVAVTSVALDATLDALHASMRQCDFAATLLLSDQPIPKRAGPEIECRSIAPLRSRSDYSRFMLRELADHIETSHALCIQWDGFVINGSAWNSRFLDFDYIGAVWPHFDDEHNVGNGGFSLRSRRLLEACRDLPPQGSAAEDVVIGRLCRPELERAGMRFPPREIAERFAYERLPPNGSEFGFHGVYNLSRHVGADRADAILKTIEPHMLARSERREIVSWALRQGRFGLASRFAARLLRRS